MKRFTDTDIWNKPWFRKAPPQVKCLWKYLCDNCDHAGVIDPDWEMFSFKIGAQVTDEDLKHLNGNVVPLGGKLHIPRFVEYQHGKLNPAQNLYKSVVECALRQGLPNPFEGLSNGSDVALPRPQGKGKGKGKVRGIVKGEFRKPTMPEMELHAAKIGLPPTEIDKFFNYYEANGWRVGRNPMKSFQAAMVHWKCNWEERQQKSLPRQSFQP